jgi:hypothetical protein
MAVSDVPQQQAEHILRVIDELGLQAYEAPEPLPEITDNDIHFVCWLASVPARPDKSEQLLRPVSFAPIL